jgi:SdrD B-like domain/Calx-beta domain
VHIWQDCTNEFERFWQLRATAGGAAAAQSFAGDVTSGDTFSAVSGIGLEGDDSYTSTVSFDFSVSPGDTDGIDFAFGNDTDACLDLTTLPEDAGVYVGSSRFPASIPLNLRTLEYCGPPIPSGQLGDYVWLDADGDGAQDAEETGYEGASVGLVDCATGEEIDSTTTDESGAFLFNTVPVGSFQMRFTLPAGYEFSPEEVGVAGGLDSNANTTTGLTRCVDMADAQVRLGFDAGLVVAEVEPLPSLSIGNASSEEDAGELVFTVSLSGGTTTSVVTFSASTADGTAVANTDYTPLATAAGTIAAGEVSTTISVTLTPDSTVEPDETLTLTLADVSPNVTVSNGSATGTIINDDTANPPPPPPPPPSNDGGGGAFGGMGLLLLILVRAIGRSRRVVEPGETSATSA